MTGKREGKKSKEKIKETEDKSERRHRVTADRPSVVKLGEWKVPAFPSNILLKL
jgi:hypothetical protein